jgi:hypothetical protein
MHRFEADGNLHKRPFPNCPPICPAGVSTPAAHIRVGASRQHEASRRFPPSRGQGPQGIFGPRPKPSPPLRDNSSRARMRDRAAGCFFLPPCEQGGPVYFDQGCVAAENPRNHRVPRQPPFLSGPLALLSRFRNGTLCGIKTPGTMSRTASRTHRHVSGEGPASSSGTNCRMALSLAPPHGSVGRCRKGQVYKPESWEERRRGPSASPSPGIAVTGNE